MKFIPEVIEGRPAITGACMNNSCRSVSRTRMNELSAEFGGVTGDDNFSECTHLYLLLVPKV